MARRALAPPEEEYLRAHKLARLATANADGAPHVVPVMYAFADGAIWFSSDPGTRKHHDLISNPRAAVVVDEPPPGRSGVEVRGRAEVFASGAVFERAQDHLIAAGVNRRRRQPGEQVYVRLTPESAASWNVPSRT